MTKNIMGKLSTQTAMQAMEIYHSAVDKPEALRVTKTGKIELVSGATVLFNRLARAINPKININDATTHWHEKARAAIFQKLTREIALVTDTVSKKDSQILYSALKCVTDKNSKNTNANWLDQLHREIALHGQKENIGSLAEAIKNISLLGKPENAALYPYVQKQLRAGYNFSEALKGGLINFLEKEHGMQSNSAKNAANTMHHLMLTYDSPVAEALFITSRAGQMVLKNELNGQKLPPLPLAYLQIHHELSLEASINIYKAVQNADKTVADAREKISVMQIYNVAFDEADAIVSFAESLESTTPKELSEAQRIEIAWLRLHSSKDPENAKLISLQAGRIHGRIPPNREAQLTSANAKIDQEIENEMSEALPAGWPDEWELMPDGSRRLKNTANFATQFMDFFQGSLSDCKIDEKLGLSDKFILDVGRSNFKFGSGDTSVTVRTDPKKAMAALESFATDRVVRQTLSKALFQAGGNGLEYAIALGLAGPGKKQFSILSADPKNKKTNASSDCWISLQHTEDGKVRVGYSLHMKHFRLRNTNTDDLLPINSRYNSSTPATDKDHTARAIAVIEFDYAQLSKGILEPKWVRPPELRLTIEPNYETLMKAMVKNKLKKTA
jgi:hypothetical protein